MTEAELREAIVAEALSWERTPYHQHARIKGVGVDCAQLPAAVFGPEGADIIPDVRPTYSGQWMNHRDEELYLREIMQWAREIDPADVRPGDLVVWKFGRTFSHSAIVVDPPIVVHAALRGGCVFRMNMDQDEDYRPERRPRRAFSVFAPDGSLVGRR